LHRTGIKMTRSTAVGIVAAVLLLVGLLLRVEQGTRKSKHTPVMSSRGGVHKPALSSVPPVGLPPRRAPSDADRERPDAPVEEGADPSLEPGAVSVAGEGAQLANGGADTGEEPAPRQTESESTGKRLAIAREGAALGAEGTVPLVNEGVESDPVTGSLRFPPGARLIYPDAGGIQPDGGAVAFWVRKEWPSDEQRMRSLLELRTHTWENRFELGMGAGYLRFLLTPTDGVEAAAGASIAWQPDEWHHVTVSWGQALMALYIDGKLAEQHTYAADLQLSEGTPLYIASSRLPGDLPEGAVSLRDFVVLDHRPDDGEISTLLTEAAPGQ
jgi:hypothetical protein